VHERDTMIVSKRTVAAVCTNQVHWPYRRNHEDQANIKCNRCAREYIKVVGGIVIYYFYRSQYKNKISFTKYNE
jgi:hypothetical protein